MCCRGTRCRPPPARHPPSDGLRGPPRLSPSPHRPLSRPESPRHTPGTPFGPSSGAAAAAVFAARAAAAGGQLVTWLPPKVGAALFLPSLRRLHLPDSPQHPVLGCTPRASALETGNLRAELHQGVGSLWTFKNIFDIFLKKFFWIILRSVPSSPTSSRTPYLGNAVGAREKAKRILGVPTVCRGRREPKLTEPDSLGKGLDESTNHRPENLGERMDPKRCFY